ncbi:unnamed protein product [Trifolium pratense]|uniref:Uncharacterized protein n=1 Tax=Trifolium pratense TaxID=57577 RepID=A0ACB0J1M0_TRIPR|nr:unnamed protein product [Trifolium pratense]
MKTMATRGSNDDTCGSLSDFFQYNNYYDFLSLPEELVKDAAKVAKEIISSSMTEIVCITQHHSIDISLKAIGFGPDRFMFARLEVDSSNVFFPQIRILSGESPRLCRQILHNSQDTFILYLTHSEKEHPNHSRNKREPSWQD